MAIDVFLQAVALGLLMAGVYALAGSGLVLVFGVMRVIDLSRGAFLVMSAYLAWVFFTAAGIDPIISLAIGGPLLYVVGVGTYKYVLSGMPRGREGLAFSVIITFGLALFMQNMISYIFTGYFKTVNTSYAVASVTLGGVLLPEAKVFASIIAVTALVGLFLFLWKTRTGTALRATVQNRDAAELVGVNVRRISMLAFGINTVTAAAAGAVISIISGFYPNTGQVWIVKLLAILMLGGMQSMGGLLVASLIMGVLESLAGVYISVSWTPLIFSATIIAVLLLRPGGLFGEKTS